MLRERSQAGAEEESYFCVERREDGGSEEVRSVYITFPKGAARPGQAPHNLYQYLRLSSVHFIFILQLANLKSLKSNILCFLSKLFSEAKITTCDINITFCSIKTNHHQ